MNIINKKKKKIGRVNSASCNIMVRRVEARTHYFENTHNAETPYAVTVKFLLQTLPRSWTKCHQTANKC